MPEEKALTTMEDNARVAKLTSDAIKASGEKVITDIRETIEAAEQVTSMLRLEADNLIEEIRRHTGNFADRVAGYVENCHNAQLMFRNYQSKLSDMPNGVVNFEELHKLEKVEEFTSRPRRLPASTDAEFERVTDMLRR